MVQMQLFSTASVNISSPQYEEDVQYRAIVNSGCNLPDTSNTLTVTVSDSLNAGVISVFEDSYVLVLLLCKCPHR